MISDLLYRVRALLARKEIDKQLDEELRFHVERQAQKHMRSGIAEEEAWRRARSEFGGIEQRKEECRDARGVSLIETTVQDMRYAMRALRSSPMFAAVAVLSLALGIGANTAVFQLLHRVLVQSLPVANPGELVELGYDDTVQHRYGTTFSYFVYQTVAKNNGVLRDTFAFTDLAQVNVARHGSGEVARGMFVTGGFYESLGLRPAIGRLLNAGDEKASSDTTPVVLSFGYWKGRFGGDPRVIGETVSINNVSFVVAGVAPEHFRGLTLGDAPDVTMPVHVVDAVRNSKGLNDTANWWLRIMGRRKEGTSVAQIQAALEPVYASTIEQTLAGWPPTLVDNLKRFLSSLKFRVQPAALGSNSEVRNRIDQPLKILIAMTGLLLVAACANLSGLLLARTTARMREVGVRLAIGCSRGRLIRQMITESLLIAVLGGAAAVLFAAWSGPLILRLLAGVVPAAVIAGTFGGFSIAFAAVLSILAGVLVGVAPAWRAARFDPQSSIRAAVALGGSRGGRAGRAAIVVQIAVSLVLVATAGQFVRSLENYRQIDAGFRVDHLVTFTVNPGMVRYNPDRTIEYARRLREKIAELPGVVSVTHSGSSMGQLSWTTALKVPGFTAKASLDDSARRNIAGPRFAETLGLKLIAGRDITEQDTKDAAPVVLVNESFVRHFFSDRDALGREIFFVDSLNRAHRIVGVVKDARDRGLKNETGRVAYSSFEHDPLGWLAFAVRVRQDSSAMLQSIAAAARNGDPAVPVNRVQTMELQIEESLERERMMAILTSAFGGLATAVAAIGLYGLLAYAVTRRTREIGVRLAVGATPMQVAWLALKDSLISDVHRSACGHPGLLTAVAACSCPVVRRASGRPGRDSRRCGRSRGCGGDSHTRTCMASRTSRSRRSVAPRIVLGSVQMHVVES